MTPHGTPWTPPPPLTKEEEIRVGGIAAAVLGDPVAMDVIEQMRADVVNEWRKSKGGEEAYRERLWHRICVIDAFENDLKTLAAGGKFVADILEMRRKER